MTFSDKINATFNIELSVKIAFERSQYITTDDVNGIWTFHFEDGSDWSCGMPGIYS